MRAVANSGALFRTVVSGSIQPRSLCRVAPAPPARPAQEVNLRDRPHRDNRTSRLLPWTVGSGRSPAKPAPARPRRQPAGPSRAYSDDALRPDKHEREQPDERSQVGQRGAEEAVKLATETELRDRADLLRLDLHAVGSGTFELKTQIPPIRKVYAGTSREVSEWLDREQGKLGESHSWFRRDTSDAS